MVLPVVLYEVNIQVDPAIEKEYLAWLIPHMKDVERAGGFIRSRLFSIGEGRWVAHYESNSLKAVEDYIQNKAAPFRQDAINRFGSKFKAERRVLQEWEPR